MSMATIDNKGGGVKLVDINPNGNRVDAYYFSVDTAYRALPLLGYKTLVLSRSISYNIYVAFELADGSVTQQTTVTVNGVVETAIPQNAVIARLSSSTYTDLWFGLKA